MTATEKPSDEADRNQIRMAEEEGKAYRKALDYMVNEVADNGALQICGDMIVGIAQERAEGMYHLTSPGHLEWREPPDANCHLEVSVSDAGDGRFIPYLEIRATLEKAGQRIGPVEVPFVWHPGLYHYGINLKVPGDGAYTITVEIAPPRFMRHDKVNGKRYADPVTTIFRDFQVKTGHE